MSDEDAEALRVRRADLHDFMREIAAAALMLPVPETYLEAERAVRAICMADRMAQNLRNEALSRVGSSAEDEAEKAGEDKQDTPPPPKTAVPLPINGAEREVRDPVRTALRALADRIMAAAKTIPMPDNALTALRALRYGRACERMLTQLYTAPKPKPVQPAKPPEPYDPGLRLAQIRRELWEQHSSSPEAQALRAAKTLADQSGAKTEAPEQPEPDAEYTAPKPRHHISEEQADSLNDQTPDPP